MARFVFLLTLLFSALELQAQFWNLQLPTNSAFPQLSGLTAKNGLYYVDIEGELYEFNDKGEILGKLSRSITPPSGPIYGFWASKKTDSNGAPYFLQAYRRISDTVFTLVRREPSSNTIYQKNFRDSITLAQTNKSPFIVELDDSTIVAAGIRHTRKIVCHSNGSFSEIWKKNYVSQVAGAVWTGTHVVVCSKQGVFRGLDVDGNYIWQKTHPISVSSLRYMDDGILGCGNSNGWGAIFKLDFEGNLIWLKQVLVDFISDIAAMNDGTLRICGANFSGKWYLAKYDENGNMVWFKAYDNGGAARVVSGPSDEAMVLYNKPFSPNFSTNIAFVGTEGTCPLSMNEKMEFEGRMLSNGQVQTHQIPQPFISFDGTRGTLSHAPDLKQSSVYIHSPWFAAIDSDSLLHTSVVTYGQSGRSDFAPGMIGGLSKDFNQVWYINRAEIGKLRRDFADNGYLDSTYSRDVVRWPARNNPHFTTNLYFEKIQSNGDLFPAPFFDYNNDGAYNIYDGDYPVIKGDRMIWGAFHDNTPHEVSGGLPFPMDVQISIYAYDCDENSTVGQTLFAEYQFINRSINAFSDVFCGFLTDFDIGCKKDDYWGALPQEDAIYGYNSLESDADCENNTTFTELPPVESVLFLNKPMKYAVVFEDSTNQYIDLAPKQYYNQLQALICQDQLPLYGTGCASGGTTPTHFSYPDNPANPSGWSMCTQQGLYGADQRAVSSYGPFNFAPNDTFTLRQAFMVHRNVPLPCPDIFGLVRPAIQQMQSWDAAGLLEAPLDLGVRRVLANGQALLLDASTSQAQAYAWSTGAQEQVIQITAPGWYKVTVTRATGCTSTDEVEVVLPTGTTTTLSGSNWVVSPNPADNWVRISKEMETPVEPTRFTLYNLSGQTVFKAVQQSQNFLLDTSMLPSGVYFLEILPEQGATAFKKITVWR